MVTQRILNISNLKTASRCWVPIKQQLTKNTKSSLNNNHIQISQNISKLNHQIISKQFYSSKIRCINFNNLNDSISLVSNDDLFNNSSTSTLSSSTSTTEESEIFEPTINSSEDIFTAGPVNRA
ncbi:hypothetical protein KGF54_000268 [Candida jiufengensis]|uniref:uncharacterized protein n=1 Tax=Candida jiufengensis TaxID=497108 RepID=UPI002224F7B4|nr:uncharacterized protein KGF54_000268 [Candida jiufengensis]KAI5957340.1 hypothetical protein KGF54_000268 [Candida jiufengensis]